MHDGSCIGKYQHSISNAIQFIAQAFVRLPIKSMSVSLYAMNLVEKVNGSEINEGGNEERSKILMTRGNRIWNSTFLQYFKEAGASGTSYIFMQF